MPRYVLPVPAKGTRHPGAGRKKGVPNRVTVEARLLASQLVNDVNYQHRLRADFKKRRVHPTIESLIWQYHLGKPSQPIAVSGAISLVGEQLDADRRAFAALELADLEVLAAESQALVDRAVAMAKLRAAAAGITPLSPPEIAESERKYQEMLGITSESDNGRYVNGEIPDQERDNSVSDSSLQPTHDAIPNEAKET